MLDGYETLAVAGLALTARCGGFQWNLVDDREGILLLRRAWDSDRPAHPNSRTLDAIVQEVDDMPSTRDLSTLPDVEGLRRLSRSLAMLDAILCPEWQYRYHSFNANWAAGREMASMRDGCGDGYFILFTEDGAILKGFAHESEAWDRTLQRGRPAPGLFDGVPDEFAEFLSEPAFSIEESTFCLWRRSSDTAWRTGSIEPFDGDDPDGSAELLQLLEGDPEAYRVWAEGYFEATVPLPAVEHVFEQRPLTAEVVKALNPELSLADLAEDISEIAYPILSRRDGSDARPDIDEGGGRPG